jgi:hypothetical protein
VAPAFRSRSGRRAGGLDQHVQGGAQVGVGIDDAGAGAGVRSSRAVWPAAVPLRPAMVNLSAWSRVHMTSPPFKGARRWVVGHATEKE